MIVLGRKVIEAFTLTDVPRNMRAVLGHIAMTRTEMAAYRANDPATVRNINDIARAENHADALHLVARIFRKPSRTSPGTRMAMLRAVDPGRRPLISGKNIIVIGHGRADPHR